MHSDSKKCKEKTTELIKDGCQIPECENSSNWNAWSEWSECPKCYTSIKSPRSNQSRTRTCKHDKCLDIAFEKKKCTLALCSTFLEPWSSWSKCDCQSKKQTQTRKCRLGPGKCHDIESKTRDCNDRSCNP